MKITIVGNTDSIVNLNKSGIPLVGKSQIVVNADTPEKENEIRVLQKSGLISIVEDKPVSSQNEPDKKGEPKKKAGRPKGAKGKNSLAQIEKARVEKAEAETQKMGSRVIVSTGDGVKEKKMVSSVINELPESDKTKESIEAMAKLEKEEKEVVLPDVPVDNKKLDPSEQMGRKAVVASAQGEDRVDMKNSILPDSDKTKARDPFIDREPDQKDDEDPDDAFLKID